MSQENDVSVIFKNRIDITEIFVIMCMSNTCQSVRFVQVQTSPFNLSTFSERVYLKFNFSLQISWRVVRVGVYRLIGHRPKSARNTSGQILKGCDIRGLFSIGDTNQKKAGCIRTSASIRHSEGWFFPFGKVHLQYMRVR